MVDAINWECPHCSIRQTLTAPKMDRANPVYFLITDASDGNLGINASAYGCSNPECRKTTIFAALRHWEKDQFGGKAFTGEAVQTHRLVPRGSVTPQPEYIPEAIRKDYEEAALVNEYSANASAALARRCLQGVLIDYAGVKKDLLARQVTILRELVDAGKGPPGVTVESVNAIDHVREIGNVGAHMETPTGMIVDVEPVEADALIELIELLFRDWYVERHNREQRYARIERIAAEKKELIASSRAAARGIVDETADKPTL